MLLSPLPAPHARAGERQRARRSLRCSAVNGDELALRNAIKDLNGELQKLGDSSGLERELLLPVDFRITYQTRPGQVR